MKIYYRYTFVSIISTRGNMKKILLNIILLCVTQLKAQQVNYSVVLDNPNLHPKTSINLEFMNLDFGFRNIEGMSFNSALWGYYEPVYGKMGVNYLARKSILSLGRMGNKNYSGVWEADLGGYLILGTTRKTKNTKVVLKSSSSTTNTGRSVTTTTFIMVPAIVKNMNGVRAGLYHKSSPMAFEANGSFAKDVKIDMETNISSQAIYGGLFTRKLRNIVINTEQYGRCINSLGTEVYFDVMLFVNNRFTSVAGTGNFNPTPGGVNVSDTIKNNTKQGVLGFRLGYKKYQIAPKSEIGKKFGMSATAEIGYRPFHGIFLNAGIGMTIGKRRPKQ
jgi:hypothetical protein